MAVEDPHGDIKIDSAVGELGIFPSNDVFLLAS